MDLKTSVSAKLQQVKVEKPKKNGHDYCWSNAQDKPSLSISNKHISDMKDMTPGQTVIIAVECTVKSCNARDDKSKDYRLDVEKMGIID